MRRSIRRRHAGRLRCERLEARIAPAFISFRAGDGFTASDDTFIAANMPQVPQSAAIQLDIAGAMTPTGQRQALLRFTNLFGADPQQIPVNATIKAATITLWAAGSSDATVPIDIYRNLMTWNVDTATWDYFADGLQTDDVELPLVRVAAKTMTKGGYQVTGQSIVNCLTAWQAGEPNGGFALVSPQPQMYWSFASGEDANLDHRPLLTVEYTLEGIHNPSYAELSGQPPSPLKLAWFDWADDLRQRRLDRVPNDRTSTFYFAQNGDDYYGHGTIDYPWKSLAKAEEVLAERPIDARLRFRRGDVWRESTTLQAVSDGITVDDYGDAAQAKPLFTRFQPLAPNAWALTKNNVYRATGMTSVGWVRGAATAFSNVYYRAASHQQVQARAFSWWFDEAGTNSYSNGQPSLYVNLNGNPASVLGGIEYCPGDAVGWYVNADNVRMQNLRLEGQGMAADGLGYGLKVVHRDQNWEFVGQGLEIYFTGYHSIGQISQYAGTKSVVTLVDVKAGYCTNRSGNGSAGSGDATVFVSYADWGGNEYYQYDCKVVSGALPSSDWAAQFGMRQGQGLYTHVGSGGRMALLLAWKTSIGQSANPVEILNNMDSGALANDLASARTYVVEDEPGPIASWWQKVGSVSINNILDQQSSPPGYNPYLSTFYYGPFQVGGWVINCTAKVDARNQFNDLYEFLFAAGPDSTKYINCHIDISNAILRTYFRNPDLGPAYSMSVTNSIVSLQSPGETGLNVINDAQHLVHNAYFLPQLSANPTLQFSGDTGGVTLTQRFAAGVSPSPSNLMFDGGVANGLEYDRRRQPRGVYRTIGPMTGAALPAPTSVKIRWGVQSMSLAANSVIPSHMTDRLSLTFNADVDVQPSSIRLSNETGPISLGSMIYDSSTHTATWLLNAPLVRGTYILELDSQPIKIFRVLPGDINGDGSVSGADFNLFRFAFGSPGPVGDFDGDGSVANSDFLMFRAVFGTSL